MVYYVIFAIGEVGTWKGWIMGKKFLHNIIEPYLKTDLIVMLFLCACILWFNILAGILCLLLTLTIQVYHGKYTRSKTIDQIDSYEESFSRDKDEIARMLNDGTPLLLCVINMEGQLLWNNSRFAALFKSEEEFYEKVDRNKIMSFFDNPQKQMLLSFDDKVYKVTAGSMKNYDGDKKMLFWSNITSHEIVKDMYSQERPCIAFINIDNYDDLLASSPSEEQSSITAEIDKMIRTFAQSMQASISRTRSSRYIMVFENKYLDELRNEKFPIINEIHKIETKADFPTSLSIGVGVGGRTLSDLQNFAADGLDLALGRGGDQ